MQLQMMGGRMEGEDEVGQQTPAATCALMRAPTAPEDPGVVISTLESRAIRCSRLRRLAAPHRAQHKRNLLHLRHARRQGH